MKKSEILSKLDSLYADGKSKNFVNHLIKSYFNLEKVTVVVEKSQPRMACSLTNQRLITKSEINNSNALKNLEVNLMEYFGGKVDALPMKKMISGRMVALTGDDTTTFLSYDAVVALVEWINGKVEEKDKHVAWLTKTLQNKGELRPQKLSSLEACGYRKPATTLGELESLQKLKAKFEAAEM